MPGDKKERKKPAPHPEEDRKALGNRLAEARSRAGLSQMSAARAIGFSGKQGISNFEAGKNLPDALRLIQLAKLYGTSVDRLCGIEHEAAWPFSQELHAEVSALTADDIRHMEASMWGFLRKNVPPGLHYKEDALRVIGELSGRLIKKSPPDAEKKPSN